LQKYGKPGIFYLKVENSKKMVPSPDIRVETGVHPLPTLTGGGPWGDVWGGVPSHTPSPHSTLSWLPATRHVLFLVNSRGIMSTMSVIFGKTTGLLYGIIPGYTVNRLLNVYPCTSLAEDVVC